MNKIHQTSRVLRGPFMRALRLQRQMRFSSLAMVKGQIVEATVEKVHFTGATSKTFLFAIYDLTLPTGDTLKCQGMMPYWVRRGDEVTTALDKENGKGVFHMLPLRVKSRGQRSPLPTTRVRSQLAKALKPIPASQYLKKTDLWVKYFLNKLKYYDTDGKLRHCVKAMVNDWPNCVFLDVEFFSGAAGIQIDASQRYRTVREVGLWKVSCNVPFGAMLKIEEETFKERKRNYQHSNFRNVLPERWEDTERGFNSQAIFPSEMCRAIDEYLSDLDAESTNGCQQNIRPLTVFHHFGSDDKLVSSLFERCADEAAARRLAERMQFVNTQTLLHAIVPKSKVNTGFKLKQLFTELFPTETHAELGVVLDQLHTAAMDARCTCLLVSHFREHILQHSSICDVL